MKVKFYPSEAYGETAAPPSKSVGQRLLICAALCAGTSTIDNIGGADDIAAVIDCLRVLGAEIDLRDGRAVVRGMDSGAEAGGTIRARTGCVSNHVAGASESDCGSDKPTGESGDEGRITADCGESGAALRFLIPVCLGLGKNAVFCGKPRLFSRPLGVYEEICRKQSLDFSLSDDSLEVGGQLKPGEFSLPGNISSQFVSGLLFALPLLGGDSIIRLMHPVESRPYIDMTIEALAKFGVEVSWEDDLTIRIAGRQTYTAADVTNEGDWSGAAYLEAFSRAGNNIKITGLREDSLQGDRVYREYFDRITGGRRVEEARAGAALPGGASAGTEAEIRAGDEYGLETEVRAEKTGRTGKVSTADSALLPEIDISDCPDLGPVLMALGAANNGVCLTGTKRLKYKESDRASAMKEELAKLGAEVEVGENRVVVYSGIRQPESPLRAHKDHRVVMALSLLLAKTGGSIEGAEAVIKSFPDFFDRLESLGINLIREY